MRKISIILGILVLMTLIVVGCGNEDKISDEEMRDIEYQELVIDKLHEDIKNCMMTMDKCIQSYFEDEHIGELKDDYREAQKTLRVNKREIGKVNISILREYYAKIDDMNKYREIRNKYNQTNRFIKYSAYTRDIIKDDKVTEDEVFNWICMREICDSEVPFSDEMKDNDEYESIVEEYGYSLIDKQNEFDKKYEVKDIN